MNLHTAAMRHRHPLLPVWDDETGINEPGSHVGPPRPSLPDLFDVEKRQSTVRLLAEEWELLMLAAKLGAGSEMPYVEAVVQSVEGQMIGDPVDVTLSELDWAALIVAARGARHALSVALRSEVASLPRLSRVLASCDDQLASQLPHNHA